MSKDKIIEALTTPMDPVDLLFALMWETGNVEWEHDMPVPVLKERIWLGGKEAMTDMAIRL